MSRYFRYFPRITYDSQVATNITKRVRVQERLLSDPYLFLPYTIKNDESPEEVAYFYYGDASMSWIILMANDILDPYEQWPMSQDKFYKYLIAKYAAQAGTSGYPVVAWTQNETITDNVVYYEDAAGTQISPSTYALSQTLDPEFVAGNWTPVRVYEYEDLANEAKRNIRVVDKRYVPQIESELRNIMNGAR